jgi:membrane-bound metal-dependent hydrolase YbcI (DUF457 family)
MDPLSHIALAHNLVRLRQPATAARGVVPAAILGALSPDVDIFLLPYGWDRYMVAHQSGTHSVIGALVVASLAAALVRVVRQGGRYRWMLGAAITGAFSHVWFDIASGASIRLLWPLVDTSVSNLGAFAMADPWVAVWCVTTAMVILWRRETQVRYAVISLAVLTLFVAAKTLVRVEVERIVSARIGAREILVQPVWGSLTEWEVYGHDATHVSQWIVDARSGSLEKRLTTPAFGSRGADDAIVGASLEWDTVRNFRRTHPFAFARTTSVGEITRVMWSDLRYCHASKASLDELTCAVSAGGERSTATTAPRLFVTIGNLVQTR